MCRCTHSRPRRPPTTSDAAQPAGGRRDSSIEPNPAELAAVRTIGSVSAATLDDLRNARRIMCAGVTGSGKSTLAAELAQQLGLPLVLIDDLCWEPGWIQPERAELDARVLPVLDRPAYVIDSVYGIHAAQALERVDVVVALDYPRATSLLRLLRRTARTRELICNGNVETLSRAFARDSIIAWHIHAWANKRARMRGWHADPTAPPVLLLRRPRDADALLADLA